MSYSCEIDIISKEMNTRSTWEDLKENQNITAEKPIEYLKLSLRKQRITN